MNVSQARKELQRMKKGDLFRLASEQKISQCLVGAKACGFYLRYKGFWFCISELLGESCIYEKIENLKFLLPRKEGIPPLLPWGKDLLNSFPQMERKVATFKVYWRNEATRTITLLGETIERRMIERRNNLIDLLTKVRKDFSNQVSDPTRIFLLGP